MKATLLGHACWAIETEGGTVLTDPVFFDPFEQGVVVSCPRREVNVDALPDLAAVYISHRHIDHFDFPSLDRLDRSVPVLCPDDPWMHAALSELGFTDLRPLRAFEPIEIGALRIVPVPSYSDELDEYGALFTDGTGTLFDQVDCPLTPESMDKIKEIAGHIDVHLAMYASQNFGFFESRSEDVTAIYANNVYNALYLGASLVVPGSAGFRFADDVGWLNKHLFPISSDRFQADLKRLDPGVNTVDILPGDEIVIDDGKVTVQRAVSPFARMVADDTHLLRYDASAPVPPLTDDNASGYDPDFLRTFVGGLVDNAILAYLKALGPTDDELVSKYRALGARYELEVVYPEGEPSIWTFAFPPDGGVEVQQGPGEVVRRIAASALADVTAGRRSAFWARTRSRRSSMVVTMGVQGGQLQFDDVRLDDLLMHLVLNLRARQVGEDRAMRDWLGLYPPEALHR